MQGNGSYVAALARAMADLSDCIVGLRLAVWRFVFSASFYECLALINAKGAESLSFGM